MKNHCHDIYLEETPLMSVTGHHWYKNDQTNILSRVSLLMWQSWTDPLILKVGSKFYYKIKRGEGINTDNPHTSLHLEGVSVLPSLHVDTLEWSLCLHSIGEGDVFFFPNYVFWFCV